MPEKEFDIVITENSVDVRHDVSSESPKRRFYAGLFFLMLIILGACVLVLLPGKHGRPNMWHSLSSSPIDSADFIVPLSLVLIFVIWMSYVGTRWLLAAYPSDEALHCDRSTLTVSKVPWLDAGNTRWITRSYPLMDISRIRFGVIASAKGSHIYGIRFLAAGKKQKVLPGLEAPEAAEILKALTTLGADVVDDPKLSKKVERALCRRLQV